MGYNLDETVTLKEDSMTKLIEQALKTATQTRGIEFGQGVLDKTGSLFTRLFPGKKALVIADENTFKACGEPVLASLRAAGVELADQPKIFPGSPTLYADYDTTSVVREYARPFDAIICSIGSGTLNDHAKLASHELGREYLNVCTAASVDGFAAFGASISRDGFKITRDCAAPAGLVMDIDVLCQAPLRLTATGYGDLIEKVPAGADWILSDELGIEPIDEYVWSLVQGSLLDSLADPDGCRAGKAEAIAKLGEGQIMSGLAMQAHNSSRPASGAGHQFSHTWEMEGHGLDWEPPLTHGFKVGIGTIASCALWQEFLRLDVNDFDVERAEAAVKTPEYLEARVRGCFDPIIAEQAVKHVLNKRVEGAQLRARIDLLKEKWPIIKERCSSQLLDPQDVWNRLKAVGAPYHPEMIKIDWDRFRTTYFKAQMIRSRYTILDILTDLGILDQMVYRLFGPKGFWGQHRHAE
ncbi:sn-glycerol-1-phosphate dehydrogenase [Mobiluncus mulieris]|uniref:sn-glycerol-1-phosphate dehydrogenase n=1 Tax=Mobiluncus mulieris TaxID=2052 RepID=UPI00019F9545|nr:sn-glycerol-1-phosphate dehydrogenase [Mobiluncus mulieris]EEJ52887.1 3-dehydroquinate synthase [Mobiluncus mulieris ATCC 35243]